MDEYSKETSMPIPTFSAFCRTRKRPSHHFSELDLVVVRGLLNGFLRLVLLYCAGIEFSNLKSGSDDVWSRVGPLVSHSRKLFSKFNSIDSCTCSWLIQEDTVVCFIVMNEGTAAQV
jgi:hypothetical protein